VPLVRVGSTALNVREWGDREAPAILFWHALGPVGSAATLGEVAPVLAARGWRVLGVDGPGFGASPAVPHADYAVDTLAALALGAADAAGAERVVLMGHSWGGAVALAAAAAAPERTRAVVLLDSGHIDYAALPGVDPSQSPAEIAGGLGEAPAWPSAEAFETELRSETERFTPDLLASYLAGTHEVDGALVGVPTEVTAAARWGLANAHPPERWPTVAAAGIPVLLLLATREPWAAQNREHLSAFEAAVPHADVRWLPEAGHDVLADCGPALGAEIAAWLEQL
jgi:pimeloyl-ACP methyl ester carboxylesterase